MKNIVNIIDKLIEANFNNSLCKNSYLYNELLISISNGKDFCLYGALLKSDKLIVNKYLGENTSIGKILLAILKKYEKVFLSFLKSKRESLFNLGDESEFINIYDKKELNYEKIEEKLYFSFLDDYSYRRRGDLSFKIEEKSVIDIYHSDFECSKCSGPKESFTNFIDYHNKDVYHEKYFGKIQDKENLHLNTNITDYESITIGGNEKINEILQDKKLIESYDIIAINKTCISVIMGDDIESILKYNNIPKEKTIYTDQNTDSGYKTIINYLKTLEISEVNKNNEILFFGLNKNKNTFELIKFLEDNFGIKVGNVLLPNINKKDLENLLSYNLAIFFKGREVKAQNIFKIYPIDNFEITVPYGIIKSYELYENILKFSNLEDNLSKLNDLFNEQKEQNIELFKKSKKYGIGFIVQDFHLKQFLEDNFRGCTIISMLTDMGFKLNFFIHETNNIYKNDIEKFNRINDADNLHNFNIIVSNKKVDLDKFIKDKNIHLYYSEIANDNRILKYNKAQFSVGDLEYGILGFYRSFESLLKKCKKIDYLNKYLN